MRTRARRDHKRYNEAAVALSQADPNTDADGYGQALRERDFTELETARINRAIRREMAQREGRLKAWRGKRRA